MKKGFTLIELLVVILVIGILATLAIVNLTSAREKSRDTKRRADVKSLGTVMEAYYNDEGEYPQILGVSDDTVANISGLDPVLSPKYLVTVPRDPLNEPGYLYEYVRGSEDMSYGIYVKYESSGACVTGVNVKAANTSATPWKASVNKCTE